MAVAYQPRTEVSRFHPAVVWVAVGLSIFLQKLLPLHFPWWSLVDLPLLVVVYFGFSRRDPSGGLLLGLAIGLAQDALSPHPLGLYGMTKTLVGFAASSLSSRIDTEQPRARLLLLFLFYHFHQVVYATIQRLLLNMPADFASLWTLEASLVNALLGVLAFYCLDRFRRTF
jgi:rod shape-determining protein MreD